jgi:GNAT superfamily N-acetyltransferase
VGRLWRSFPTLVSQEGCETYCQHLWIGGFGQPLASCDVSVSETLSICGGMVTLRKALRADVVAIVRLLSQDPLGASRDGVAGADGLEPYWRAFEAIDSDPGHMLMVADRGGCVVATMQLSFLPGMARGGAVRAQIEAVRVEEKFRGDGLGTAMVEWAIGVARSRGCAVVQLTSDKSRQAAHRFYERLGFVASHEGYKISL